MVQMVVMSPYQLRNSKSDIQIWFFFIDSTFLWGQNAFFASGKL